MPRPLDALQGTWMIRSLILDGEPLPSAMLAGAHVVITGDRFVSHGMGAEYSGVLVPGNGKAPRALDMRFETGPEKGNTNPCIYELDGDTLKLCIATRGSVRPTSFRSPPGSGFALETLTRGDAGAAASSAPGRSRAAAGEKAGGGPASELEGEWRMVSGVMGGQPMADDAVKWVKRVTEGRRTSVHAGPQVLMAFEFTSDPAKSPKTIDYVHTAGAHKGKTQLGVYELAAGRLTILMAAPGEPRPTRLDAAPGRSGTLTVWERAR